MAKQTTHILLELKEAASCFASAVQPVDEGSPPTWSLQPTPWPQPVLSDDQGALVTSPASTTASGRSAGREDVWLPLQRAREAVQAVATATQTAAATEAHSVHAQEGLLREAATAAEALTSVAAAVTAWEDSGPRLSAAAAEALSITTQLAHDLARWQQQQALASASAAQQAAAEGSLRAAAAAAVRAKEAAAVAMWAACVGGLQSLGELRGGLDAAMREADGAVQAARAAVAAASTARPFHEGLGQRPAGSKDGAATAAAATATPEDGAATAAAGTATAEDGAATAAATAATSGAHRASHPAAEDGASTMQPLAPPPDRHQLGGDGDPAPGEQPSAEEGRARDRAGDGAGAASERGAAPSRNCSPTEDPDKAMAAAPDASANGPSAAVAAAARSAARAAAAADCVDAQPFVGTGAVEVAAAAAVNAGACSPAVDHDGSSQLTAAADAQAPPPCAGRSPDPQGGGVDIAATAAVAATGGLVPPPPTCRNVQRAAVLRLVAAVDTATADGAMSEASLRDATDALKVLVAGLQNPDAPTASSAVATAAAASTPPCAGPAACCAAFKLLSYALRQLCELLTLCEVPADRRTWVDTLCGAADYVQQHRMWLRRATPGGWQAKMAEGPRVMARTGVPQCVSALFAGMAEAAVEAVGRVGAAVPAGQVAEVAADAAGPDSAVGFESWAALQDALVTLLNWSIISSSYSQGKPEGREAARALLSAYASSRTLEQLARAEVLGWRAVVLAGRDTTAAASGLRRFLSMLSSLLWIRLARDRPNVMWADVLLSGPCVQRALLLHVVSQLCAADGGPDYGLPEGALLPPQVPQLILPPAGKAGTAQGQNGEKETAAQERGGSVILGAEIMVAVFHWWAHNRARPCSDRALRAVCERAAAAASASWAGGDAGPWPWPSRFSPSDSLDVAVAALECAFKLTRSGSAGDFRGLWGPAVRTADAAVRIRPERPPAPAHGSFHIPVSSALQLLLKLPLPPLSEQQSVDTGALAAGPCPDLAAALDAGYVAALERALRAEMCAAVDSRCGSQLADVLRGMTALLKDSSGLASLMAYGDLTSAAQLIATSAKALGLALSDEEAPKACCGAAAVEAAAAELLGAFSALTTRVGDWAAHGRDSRLNHWWWDCDQRVRSIGDPRWVAVAGAAPSGSDSQPGVDGLSGDDGGPAGGCGPGGSASEGTERQTSADGDGGLGGGHSGDAVLTPARRLSLLAAFACTEYLPVLRRLLDLIARRYDRRAAPPAHLLPACSAALQLVPPLVQAYMDCRAAAVLEPLRVTASAAASAPDPGIGVTPPAAAAGAASSADVDRAAASAVYAAAAAAAAAADAAASWEALLLGPLDLPGLVAAAAGALTTFREGLGSFDSGGAGAGALQGLFGAALHLLVAFPARTRPLLRSPVTPKAKSTLSRWLQDAMRNRQVVATGLRGAEPLTLQEIQLLKALTATPRDGYPGPEDVVLLRGSALATGRRAALIPPPCFTAAMLPLAGCADPACISLEGESEAGLRRGP